MSRKYKINDDEKLYFVSFATVFWVDVFIREEYREIIIDSLKYCQKNKGLEIYAWCIMPSHLHLIIGTNDKPLSDILRDFKSFTSRELRAAINRHPTESRKKWMLRIFEWQGQRNSNNLDWQFWQQDNHPIVLFNNFMMDQKLEYIHQNPVVAGFVDDASAWLYSSARDYDDTKKEKGLLDILFIN
jgi:REP element-mobilizing transposase RayT